MHIFSICTTDTRPKLGPMLKDRTNCTFVYLQLHTLFTKQVVYFHLFNCTKLLNSEILYENECIVGKKFLALTVNEIIECSSLRIGVP